MISGLNALDKAHRRAAAQYLRDARQRRDKTMWAWDHCVVAGRQARRRGDMDAYAWIRSMAIRFGLPKTKG